MPLPPLTHLGELPLGVHRAPLQEVIERFGAGSLQRGIVAGRLDRVYRIAKATGQLARFVLFVSFVTDKPEPNDVDVFLLMQNDFDGSQLREEAILLFDHAAAAEYWQVKRGGGQRGIVEIVEEK